MAAFMQLNLSRPRRRNLISLTPLIDVVFILLLFFMLTSSFIQWRNMELNVAQASTSSSQQDDKVVRLSTNAEGDALYQDQSYTLAQLPALMDRLQQDAIQRVILQPHDDNAIQQIIYLMDALKQQGIEQITLNTD